MTASQSPDTHDLDKAIDFDVIIVGAGLVGSAMACALAADNSGELLRIAVVEAGGEPAVFEGENFDPRVVALTQASQKLLVSVGAWPLIVAERACPYTDMAVWDADGTGSIHFDSHEVQQNSLGHIVENSVVTRALLTCLRAYPQITLLQPAKVSSLYRDDDRDKQCVLLDDGRKLSAPLLLAADGANSKVRELANMATREWNYGHDAIVTTVQTEKPHQHTAWQRFLSTGPLAFLPLHAETADHQNSTDNLNTHYSSIVWSLQSDRAPQLMALDDADFAKALSQAFEHRLGEIVQVSKRFSFPLRQRHAVDYVQQGIALLGDAAHTIHPLAGQGVNLGFLDVCAMRDEILRAQVRQLPLTDMSILKRYQRSRKSNNLAMMTMMEGFKRLFAANHLPTRWLRNQGMKTLDGLPALKKLVVKQAMGL